ncbi:hexon [California sea lion adenovirus 1]|uniref:Hexon protein n=1 Tax=California sea lion adenovirus 1 TaxID=943083 RepID=A0A059XN69_9ADEN|nr:hexon [California sea lion adenovirus 1]AIA22357.1 hexon [California sea lion adenovirus 1]
MAAPSMMPQWSYMHIAGQDASEYLSPALVQFSQATETYFQIGNKFRNPTVAPTHDVTTERSQRLQLRFTPVTQEDTQYAYKVRFQLTVGDNRVLDMGSTYFDIRGRLDRGPSFKPYSGTAYNAMAPKSGINNCQYKGSGDNNGKNYILGQASFPGSGYTDQGLTLPNKENQQVAIDKKYQPEPQIGIESWSEGTLEDSRTMTAVGGRCLNITTPQTPCYGSYAKPTNKEGGQGTGDVNIAFFQRGAVGDGGDENKVDAAFYMEDVDLKTPDTHLVYKASPQDAQTQNGMGQQAAPNRPNYIGFRDNFIGLLYYNSNGNLGVLAGQASQLNAVVELQDRNTELSYQLLLDTISDRHQYFSMWNQAVDSYDPDVRIIDNRGVEDELPNYCFPLMGIGDTSASTNVNANGSQRMKKGIVLSNKKFIALKDFEPTEEEKEEQDEEQLKQKIRNRLRLTEELFKEAEEKLKRNAERNATLMMNSRADNNLKANIALGNVSAMEINLRANLWKSFLYSNVALYLPDSYKFTPDNIEVPDNPNTYQYMNNRIPFGNLVDTYVNIGARWSLDAMDTVNPFNHHRNDGLCYRSQLLGNGRYCSFHIQVPQKFFALKNLLLLPGSYTYEWSIRKDVNMILQSTLGNDLRVDGASITFTSVNLFASFFPMAHNTCSTLEAMLRNDVNDQSFNDYLSSANMLFPIPANATQLPISIPSRNWAGFRGWSFTRLKQKETPALGSPFDPYFTYSGSIPYLDGTFYLSHTFRRLSIMFDSSVSWPGNDRLLTPNEFEIKRYIDGDGYNVAQCNMTKDWFLVQMLANYNIGFQGYHLPPDHKNRLYSFMRNFEPMTRQIINELDETNKYFGVNVLNQHNSSGYTGFKSAALAREGHPYPANWPYPLIGNEAVSTITQKKFLCDRTMWRIPFSSNFMSMGALTDLGQNLLYANAAHALDMVFEVDPIDEPTLLYILFEVFDVCRIHQPHRGVIEAVYLRTPFSAGNATT